MTYTYGTDNLPSGYTANTNTGTYTYDALNRLKKKTSGITPTVNYTYRSGTSMVQQETYGGNMSAYYYDANGNIGSITDGTKTIFYKYDELNRIIGECNQYTNQTVRYKYDAWGNIAMVWVFSGSNTWNPDSSKLVKKIDYVYSSSTEGMAWKDLLTKYDGKTITYDAIGNPTSYMGSAMTWEGRTLVEQIKNGTTITYSYDSSDMRTSKTVGGVKHNYYYVEGKLMYEDCPSYKLFYAYDANGFLSGIKRVKSNGTTENFGVHCNIFGDVIAIYEYNTLVAKYSYDSWGKLLSITDEFGNDISDTDGIWLQNSIRYRGYVYDEETGLYYLQSRYYDPNTGRFINADNYDVLATTPSSFTDKNLFAYCDNNPIRRTDSNGQIWTTIGIMAVGGVIGAGINVASSIISQQVFDKNINWKSVLISAGTGFVSGAIGASPLGVVWQTILGGIVSGISYVADSTVNDISIDAQGLIIAVSFGAISGRLGGSGANENLTITNTIDTVRKALSKEHRRILNNPKYAQKAISSWTNYAINTLSTEAWEYAISYASSELVTNNMISLANITVDTFEFYLQWRQLMAIL